MKDGLHKRTYQVTGETASSKIFSERITSRLGVHLDVSCFAGGSGVPSMHAVDPATLESQLPAATTVQKPST